MTSTNRPSLRAVAWAVGLAMAVGAADARAVTFAITYDDMPGDVPGESIIGMGTFSFDGPLALGEFPLDSLSGIEFSATIAGSSFATADIATDLSSSGVLIFEDAGKTLATFTGSGGGPARGSFDLVNDDFFLLTHEPGPAGVPCCGGTDVARLYMSDTSGLANYQMVLIPEPATLGVFALGLLGGAALGRRPGTVVG